MTHEQLPNSEADGGPEQDDYLPDAATIPVAPGPDELSPAVWDGEWDSGG
jgi:hypothetical protein